MKKMKKIFIKSLTFFSIGALIFSCTPEDYTGHSTSSPTSPNTSIALDFSSPVVLVEDDSVWEYTVSLSETQIVDVKLHVEQIGGTADSHDYEMTELVVIPAGYTTATAYIKILSDDLIEDTETLKVQIGDDRTANTTLAPVTVDFAILNYEDGDLVIDMAWDMSEPTTDTSGETIDPTDFADMILTVSTTPNFDGEIGNADGGSFETYVLDGDEPDGDYYILASFYAANEEIIRDLNLDLEFNQSGVINGDTYDYPSAINNASICENNFFVMTKITKMGTSYTFEDQSINNFINQQISYTGTDAGYDSQVSTGVDCAGMTIAGLNAEWMFDFWGETIEEEGTVYWTVDDAGVVTIESQYVFTTDYSGDLYDYTVTATGTYNEATGELYLQYYLDQDGFSPSNWAFDNGYQDTPYFEATLMAASDM